jgi:hypothetical protein
MLTRTLETDKRYSATVNFIQSGLDETVHIIMGAYIPEKVPVVLVAGL